MDVSYEWTLLLLWTTWGAYWGLRAVWSSRPERRETRGSRLIHLVLVTAALLLLFFRPLSVGPLAWRLYPAGLAAFVPGVFVTLFGLVFATWARIHLGPYWTGAIAVVAQQRIVDTGPYRLVRHPIYSGLIVAFLGTAIAVGELRAVLGAVSGLTAYWRKTCKEEAVLIGHFGAAYEEYRRRVKAVIPFLL